MHDLQFEVLDGIGRLTLDRPDKRNAMTTEMYHGVVDILAEVKRDDAIKVLLVTGAGTAFCAGSDAEQRLAARVVDDRFVPLERTRADLLEPVMLTFAPAFYDLGKPSIALVNGVAVGAGLSIALLCDIRLSSDRARYAASWLNVGLMPDCGATFTLPRLVGVDRALQLCLTGEVIDAREAHRLNLVTEVVPHDELDARATELARRIADGPSVAIELTRRALYQGLKSGLQSQLSLENQAQNLCFMSEDFKEGLRAFQEKRRPRFSGR